VEFPGGISGPEPSDPPSVGEVHPVTGLPRWVERSEAEDEGITWRRLLEQWDLIEVDMQEFYSIDLDTPGLTQERSGRWLRTRILGLLRTEGSRLRRCVLPTSIEKGG